MDAQVLLRPINEQNVAQKALLNLLLSKAVALAQLPNNWDGYGAISPNSLVNNQLNMLIKLLPERLLQYTTAEEMYATPHGTIVLDFKKGGNELTIEFGEREYGFFTDLQHGKNIKIKRTMYQQNQISDELAEAINSFYRS
jgi:hypothetical protein